MRVLLTAERPAQPPLLVQRLMLNLRQLDRSPHEHNSDADHLSRFSVSFRVPSDILGNIGEPLDLSQHSDGPGSSPWSGGRERLDDEETVIAGRRNLY